MTHTPCTQTGHNTLSPRFENSTTNPETPFYGNPLSKAKAHSAGAKGNGRQGFQKGLATSRSNPGLLLTILILLPTVTVNICTHNKVEKSPQRQVLDKEQTDYGSLLQ